MLYFCIVILLSMFNSRFFLAWLLSALFMYIAFYLFHGVLTNDLLKSSLPKTFFLSVAAVVYLVVAFGMSLLFKSTSLSKSIKKPYMRGLLIGCVTAFFLYGVAFTIGISFSFKTSMINVAVDVCWQLIEQNIGAFLIVLTHTLFYREEDQHVNFL